VEGPKKPEAPGSWLGQRVWTEEWSADHYCHIKIQWEWRETGPQLYAVGSSRTLEYLSERNLTIVATGLSRDDAAALAGLVLKDKGVACVALLSLVREGDWFVVGGGDRVEPK